MADPKRDGYEPPVVDGGEPKSIAAWMYAMPQNLSEKALKDIKAFDFDGAWLCESLADALYQMYLNCNGGPDFFWRGVRHYVLGRKEVEIDEDGDNGEHVRGFRVAKAAFEAEKANSPEHSETVKKATYSVTVKNGMASMPWKDFSILTDKAALWDAHEANRRAMISETNQWIAEVDVLWEKFKEIRKGFGL